jgi:hypothetical protein
MRSILSNLLTSLTRTSGIVSLMVSATCGGFAFLAYRDFMSGADLSPALTNIMAGGAAATCGGSLHLIYTGVLGGIPAIDRLARPKFIRIIAALGLCITAFSTYPNIWVTAGNDALEIHNARQNDKLVGAAGNVQTVALSAGQAAPSLDDQAKELARKAASEAATGYLSGTPGAGDLTDALNSAASKVGTAAALLGNASTATTALMPDLTAALARGDDITARGLLAEIRATIPFDTMKAIAADLRSDLGIVGSAKNPTVRARQNEAIAQLQRDLAGIADGLDEAMKRLRGELDAISLPERETITKAKAIWIYADQLIPQIALGVALDWVLIVTAFLMAMIRDAMPAPDDDVSDISLADARRVHRELKKLIRDIEGGSEPDPADAPPWSENQDEAPTHADLENVVPFPGAAE